MTTSMYFKIPKSQNPKIHLPECGNPKFQIQKSKIPKSKNPKSQNTFSRMCLWASLATKPNHGEATYTVPYGHGSQYASVPHGHGSQYASRCPTGTEANSKLASRVAKLPGTSLFCTPFKIPKSQNPKSKNTFSRMCFWGSLATKPCVDPAQ